MTSRIQLLLEVTATIIGLAGIQYSQAHGTHSQIDPIQPKEKITVDDLAKVAKDLSHQVHLLTCVVGELKSEVAHLKNTRRALCDCKNDSNVENTTIVTNETGQNATITDSYNPFIVKEIKSTIHYKKHVNYSITFSQNDGSPFADQFTYWNRQEIDYSYRKLSGITFEPKKSDPQGNYTASVVTTVEDQTSVLFVFGTKTFWYVLRLNNSVAENMTLTNISLPETNYAMPDEIIYTRGQNASLVLTESNVKIHSMDEVVTIADRRNEFIESTPFWDLSSNTSTPNGRVFNITINTSEAPLTGVLSLKATLQDPQFHLLEKIEVYKRVPIYPSDKSHPFNDNFFGFETKYPLNGDLKNTPQTCITEQLCIVRCPRVIGSNLTRMSVSYFVENGNEKILQETSEIVEDPFYVCEFEGVVPQVWMWLTATPQI